ncbi:MAG: threonine--tRNA ligase [Candidatus Falkowbacteria bacterium]
MTEQNVEMIRHSLSHVMAAAIKELYPEVKFAIGPAIENGFYYDIDFGDTKISDDDLPVIEKKMAHLLKQNLKFERTDLTVDEAIAQAEAEGQPYKQELITDLKKNGETKVSFYTTGGFTDLCRGPHIENTNQIKPGSFTLNKLAGAYWRGDEKNKMLTRIYGLAFLTKVELDEHLAMIIEAEKRDHRKLGKELDLFHIDEVVGLGLPLWHPKGAMLWRIIEDFWYLEHIKNGYELVRSPHVGNKSLWEQSGHWGFYNDSMYPPLEVGQTLKDSQDKLSVTESEQYLLKPMNCPFHIRIYNNHPHSYRELPFRWAECGTVYRHEKKGQLSGLTRVRGFTQDDAHIICRSDQVENELKKVIDFILYIFNAFGFNIADINVYLSVRDPENDKYAGTDEGWSFTESILEKVAIEKNLNISKDIGGAVFYGPKLDFKIKDALGREWQCSTLQFDFNLTERFDMTFVNNKGEHERPYMLHRALFGSYERFIGLLIEHYAGSFPVWLSPVQVRLISVGESHIDYCHDFGQELRQSGVRVEVDDSDETVGNKTRKAVNEKTPYILVIGDQEMNSDKLAVRDRGSRETRQLSKLQFIEEIKNKITTRT